MARRKSIDIRSRLKELISQHKLWKFARESGFVKRVRKVQPVAFFWTLVLGFATGRERRIAGLRRAYAGSTGVGLVPSSFYDRFTPELTAFLKAVFCHLVSKVSEATHPLRGVLSWLKDMVVTDATVIRLHDVLQGAFAACRTNHTKAAAKLHVVMSVLGHGPRTVKITSERQPDGKKLTVGQWCRDRLLLFDLGYYRFGLFEAIRSHGGYFLSRLKENASPTITAVHSASSRAACFVGQRLKVALLLLNEPVLDFEAEFSFRRRLYRGVRRTARVRFRVVAILNEETSRYHLYVTNLPVGRITPEDVAEIYRARWEVELTFRHLKSCFRLEDISSRKKHIVEALIYASLLTLIVSKDLLRAVREKLRKQSARIKEGRWSELFNSFADRILLLLTSPLRQARDQARLLEPLLLREAVDPHVHRPGLLDQAQNGTTCAGV